MSFLYHTYAQFGGNMQSCPNVADSKHNVSTSSYSTDAADWSVLTDGV